jgi:hypothetical protein
MLSNVMPASFRIASIPGEAEPRLRPGIGGNRVVGFDAELARTEHQAHAFRYFDGVAVFGERGPDSGGRQMVEHNGLRSDSPLIMQSACKLKRAVFLCRMR